jgi:diacylglycerol kinase (ATP)
VAQLLGRDVAIGLIPGGTANVVARELGIPIDLKGATEVLLEGHIRRLDIGRIRRTLGDGPGFDDVFLAMVGVGIDADVVENVLPGPFKMTRFGVALTRRLIRGQPTPLRLTVDGVERPGPTFGTIVANTANYGGWFSACPDARPDDGDLDWLQVRGESRCASLRVLAAMVRKRRGPPAVAHYGTGRTFAIESLNGHPALVQADGDACGTTPICISIDPARVAMIAP